MSLNLRIHRSFTLMRGVKLNLSRRGASLSVRMGGLGTLNVGTRGVRWTGRTPIKGVSYSKRLLGPLVSKAPDGTTTVDADYKEHTPKC